MEIRVQEPGRDHDDHWVVIAPEIDVKQSIDGSLIVTYVRRTEVTFPWWNPLGLFDGRFPTIETEKRCFPREEWEGVWLYSDNRLIVEFQNHTLPVNWMQRYRLTQDTFDGTLPARHQVSFGFNEKQVKTVLEREGGQLWPRP